MDDDLYFLVSAIHREIQRMDGGGVPMGGGGSEGQPPIGGAEGDVGGNQQHKQQLVLYHFDLHTYSVSLPRFQELFYNVLGPNDFQTQKPPEPLHWFAVTDSPHIFASDKAFIIATVGEIAKFVSPAMGFASVNFEDLFRQKWTDYVLNHPSELNIECPNPWKIMSKITRDYPPQAYLPLSAQKKELLIFQEQSMPERFSIALRKYVRLVSDSLNMQITAEFVQSVQADLVLKIRGEAWVWASVYKDQNMREGEYIDGLVSIAYRKQVEKAERALNRLNSRGFDLME